MFFRDPLEFSMIQQMLAVWCLVPLSFLNPACTSRFMYCWSLVWRILSITLLACEMSAIVWQFEHSLALSLFGIGMKSDLFQSCGHCWVFQICWHTEWSTFTASSFKIWNSSTGIPSPPLALFVVMLLKAHLTSYSKMPLSHLTFKNAFLNSIGGLDILSTSCSELTDGCPAMNVALSVSTTQWQ